MRAASSTENVRVPWMLRLTCDGSSPRALATALWVMRCALRNLRSRALTTQIIRFLCRYVKRHCDYFIKSL